MNTLTCVSWNPGSQAPTMVVGFPDLSDADLDAIFAHAPAFEAQADQDEYDWGWTAWGLRIPSEYLTGLALMGWEDAEAAYAEERAAERQLTAQLLLGYERANGVTL
mgnify:CR=1 FL=1